MFGLLKAQRGQEPSGRETGDPLEHPREMELAEHRYAGHVVYRQLVFQIVAHHGDDTLDSTFRLGVHGTSLPPRVEACGAIKKPFGAGRRMPFGHACDRRDRVGASGIRRRAERFWSASAGNVPTWPVVPSVRWIPTSAIRWG
ncbi:hypothetical protein ACFQZ4_05235 [Catellatospora coxensis]